MSEVSEITTTCCIAGGGPAGVMLGLLLARSGVNVVVLEKHADFFRDFRGDTIHPSTMEALHELGLLDEFLTMPHQIIRRLAIKIDDEVISGPDFSHLDVRCPYIALIPQWDFLTFLAQHAERYPGFHLRMSTEVVNLVEADGRVVGVRAKTADGDVMVRADLVIGADGRHSTVRRVADLEVDEIGVPIDVLWFRLSKGDAVSEPLLGRVRGGTIFLTIDRGNYFQCGDIIPKGHFEQIRQRGLPAFRASIAAAAPELKPQLDELVDWDQVKLLTVQINRLKEWCRPGLLCIGDAAHAMSPAGGVGINLAIQDAIATSNRLAHKLRERSWDLSDLQYIQRRRESPTKKTQRLQACIHRRMFDTKGGELRAFPLNWFEKTLLEVVGPWLRRFAATSVGLGFLPEHIATSAFVPDERPDGQ